MKLRRSDSLCHSYRAQESSVRSATNIPLPAELDPIMNFREEKGAITFTVRVIPRSSRSEIVGEHDGALKVRLASPPVDGAANAELIKLFAKALGVAKSNVHIISGETSKTKLIRIAGATSEQVRGVVRT